MDWSVPVVYLVQLTTFLAAAIALSHPALRFHIVPRRHAVGIMTYAVGRENGKPGFDILGAYSCEIIVDDFADLGFGDATNFGLVRNAGTLFNSRGDFQKIAGRRRFQNK